MQNSLMTFARMLDSKNLSELESNVKKAVSDLGFNNFMLASSDPVKSLPIVPDLHDYPAEWIKRYTKKAYAKIDPVMSYGLSGRHFIPMCWGNVHHYPSKRIHLLHQEAMSHGIHCGIAVPFVDLSQKRSAFLASLNCHGKDARTFLQANSMAMQYLACYVKEAWDALSAQPEAAGAPQPPVLTPREMDCLSWAAMGKTAWETGQILAISEWTVVYHLENLKRKLGVSSKEQAIARAISAKLL